MQRSLSAFILSVSVSVSIHAALGGTTSEALARARTLLERNDPAAAADLLEEALPSAAHDRRAVLDLLRRAYESAARQAEAAGRAKDAQTYRDNLEILNRKPKGRSQKPPTLPAETPPPVAKAEAPKSEPAPKPAPKPALEPPAPEPVAPLLAPEPVAPLPAPAASQPVASAPAVAAPSAANTPLPATPPAASIRVEVKVADEAFKEHRYEEAGRIYATLDREHRLPPARRDHWAYCLCVDVAAKINAKPKTAREWAEINAEISKIKTLSPKKWFGEYLRNLVDERAPIRQSARSNKIVVRGAAPEEAPLGLTAAYDTPVSTAEARPLLDVGSSTPRAQGDLLLARAEPKRVAEESKAAPAPEAERSAPRVGNWLVIETQNFRILYADHTLAQQVSRIAESVREEQIKRWTGTAPREPWSPRCDIYLYPDAQVYSRMTGQPEESPGFSTMGMNGGRIIARRVNLRADHPNLRAAVLPHEVTHVVLADLFAEKQIPRWADEGMAVLSEPNAEQRLRAADLDEPLSKGRLFRLQELMAMDYPDGQFWGLYYAQSVSLTRYLVEQSTPKQFIEFVQGAQRRGLEAELRRVYGIDGFEELEKRWVAYARTQSETATASSDPAPRNDRAAR